MKCPDYETSSMKCPVSEMSYLLLSFYEMTQHPELVTKNSLELVTRNSLEWVTRNSLDRVMRNS